MTPNTPADERLRADRRKQRLLWMGCIAITVVLFLVALRLLGPPPPRRIVLAAGPVDGVYYRHAQGYRDVLARDGVTVEILPTAGAVENLRLLREGQASVAFVQGGVATDEDRRDLRALGSIFLEPFWVFHRRSLKIPRVGVLKDERMAIGPEGSGTRWLARVILTANGVIVADAVEDDPRLRPLGGSDAATALLEGRVDVAFFVVAPEAPYIETLLGADDIDLLHLRRWEAYVRRHRFLAGVTLPEGVLDLDRDVPAHDLRLLASTAALVAPAEVHSMVPSLLIDAAREVHGVGSLLSEPGRFPSPHHVQIPLSEDARRYYDHGPSWLYRVFPFWIATFLDRAIILLLPLLTLLIPLAKTAPPVYRWALRRRIYRWYRVVREADRANRPDAEAAELQAQLDKLRAIEGEVANVSVPLPYMKEFYDLREHMDFAVRHLEAGLSRHAADDTAPKGTPAS